MHEKVSPIRPLATAMTQAPNKVTPFVGKKTSKYDKKLRYRLFWLLRQYKTAQQQENHQRARVIAQHIEELINPSPTPPPIAHELNATLAELKQKICQLETQNTTLLQQHNDLQIYTENKTEQDLVLAANHEKIQQRQHQLERLQQHIDSSQQDIDKQCAKFNTDIMRGDSLVNLWQDRLSDFQLQANSQQRELEGFYQGHNKQLQQQRRDTQQQTQQLLDNNATALAKSHSAHKQDMGALLAAQKQQFNSHQRQADQQQKQVDQQQSQNKGLFNELKQQRKEQQKEQSQRQEDLSQQQQKQQRLQTQAQQNLDLLNQEIGYCEQQNTTIKELLEKQYKEQEETSQQNKFNQQRQQKLQSLIDTQHQELCQLENTQSSAKQQLEDHAVAQKASLELFETLHKEANQQLATLIIELQDSKQQQEQSKHTNDANYHLQQTQNTELKQQLHDEIRVAQEHLEQLEQTKQELKNLSGDYDNALTLQNQSYDSQQLKLKNLNEKILSSERLQQDQRKTQQTLQQQLDILNNETEKSSKLACTLEQSLAAQKPQVEKLEQLLAKLPNSLDRAQKASQNVEHFLNKAEGLFDLNTELLEKHQSIQNASEQNQLQQQEQLKSLRSDWKSFSNESDIAQQKLDKKHLAIDDGINRVDQLQLALATQIQTLDLVIDDNKPQDTSKELEKRLKTTLKEQLSRALLQRDKGPEIEELHQKQNQLVSELDEQKTKNLNDKHFAENEQTQLNKQLQDLQQQSELQAEKMQHEKNQHQQQLETQNLELKQLQKNSGQQLNQIQLLSDKIGDLNQRRNDFDPSQQLRSRINQLQEQLDYAAPRHAPPPTAQGNGNSINWSWGIAAALLFCVMLSTFQVYQQNQTILRLQSNTDYSATGSTGNLTLEDITLSSEPTQSNKRAHYHSFSWPVQSSDSQAQQITYRKLHSGINIQANTGAPIFAITQGKVIYSDSGIRGYGNVIVIEHEQDLMSVYANTKVNYVKAGDLVEKGQLLGDVGVMSGANKSGLYFEIRHKGIAEDPFLYLSSEG